MRTLRVLTLTAVLAAASPDRLAATAGVHRRGPIATTSEEMTRTG
jgi:hypothetical protein